MTENSGGAYCVHLQEYSCEICGMSGLTDDSMREHTRTCHVEGNAQCPFCGLSGIGPAGLLLHVNQAHLDYLTPENEAMSFIDDQSPGNGEDSDTLSDYKLCSPEGFSNNLNLNQKCITNTNTNDTFPKINELETCKSLRNMNVQKNIHSMVKYDSKENKNGKEIFEDDKNHMPSCSNSIETNDKNLIEKNKNIEINGSNKENINDHYVYSQACQGSPLRSQLGLKLKTNSPAINKFCILQCPLCSYTSENANILQEHINRSHFDPLSPSINGSTSTNNYSNTLTTLQCPICLHSFQSSSDLELHVNIEHRDILSPGKANANNFTINNGYNVNNCPICNINLNVMKLQDVELHIENHFIKSPRNSNPQKDIEKEAQKLREQREFEMLRAQYGMDDQGNFREQSAAAMQRAVYAGEMSVADYYERQVSVKYAESHGIDDGTSCTKSVSARVLSLSSSSSGVIKSLVCSSVDHYASSYGDKGWGCGYRNLQMLLSSLLQNTTYNEAIYSAWGTHGPSRTAMPSISRLQKMVEAAWAQGFDIQGSEQLGCKLYNTRKWIGATEVVTVLSWLRINCQLIDFHRPTSSDGRHPDLFNWVFQYFDEPGRVHTPPLYLQHQGHSRTIIGIEQKPTGLTLLILDPSHGPRQVAALGSSQDSLRLIRRGSSAMRAPQYQIVAVKGIIDTEEQYQASKVLNSLRIPPDR